VPRGKRLPIGPAFAVPDPTKSTYQLESRVTPMPTAPDMTAPGQPGISAAEARTSVADRVSWLRPEIASKRLT
jgi:hypothetical protein